MILDVIPELPKDFGLKQKDEWGDHITIQSDEDLKYAVKECLERNDKYLKLFAFPKCGAKFSSSSEEHSSTNETKRYSSQKNLFTETPCMEKAAKACLNACNSQKDRKEATYTAWVGGLGKHVTGMHLRRLFAESFESVVNARVIHCPLTGHSRFGFVEFKDPKERDTAIKILDGEVFLTGKLRVKKGQKKNQSKDRRRSPAPSKRMNESKENKSTKAVKRPFTDGIEFQAVELRGSDSPTYVRNDEIHFSKTWILMNSGHKQWPEQTHLLYVGGAICPQNYEIFLPPLLPGKITFATATFKSPKFVGEYSTRFRISGPNGQSFGTGLGVGATFRIIPAKKYKVKENQYEKEIEQLAKCGYRDSELNEHLLQTNNGDVTVCLKWLEKHIGISP
eukprot:CAMPEP_0167747288 /NCGR_PEP_ID=MMETSP0110_2-20121227/4199_1 /TAXON_ID=629695 /ORGANISM="Gymnochlora sp., Strain CCMP2014" /LENGTH=392 /DNA_ID=CAMNT_0007632175 /DNA_START=156 /DNA_END=1334 /DNA_ORIENTATION=-